MLLNSTSLRLLLNRDKKRPNNRPSSAATDVQQLVRYILEEETSRYSSLNSTLHYKDDVFQARVTVEEKTEEST